MTLIFGMHCKRGGDCVTVKCIEDDGAQRVTEYQSIMICVPQGSFSDGRVWADHLASYARRAIKSILVRIEASARRREWQIKDLIACRTPLISSTALNPASRPSAHLRAASKSIAAAAPPPAH